MTPKSLATFWEKHPNGRIETAVVNCRDGEVIVRAEVYASKEDTKPFATGHAYERDEMMAVENALEIAGYHGGEGGVVGASEQTTSINYNPGEFEVKWRDFQGKIKDLPPKRILWLAANYTGKDNEAKKAAKAYLEQHPEVLAQVGKSA